ncbi:MAG TPA: beta-N-acetylhexosaminidase [Bacteroidia bacterium]|nr:beta-N-acetylhexosaminidase [Bacteroidia bacterium]
MPQKPAIIPEPVAYSSQTGNFSLDKQTVVVVNGVSILPDLQLLLLLLDKDFDLHPKIATDLPAKNAIVFEEQNTLNPEAYELKISEDGIRVKAKRDGSGFFYAIQSLIQVLHSGISGPGTLTLPCLLIKDEPRFSWRGMHLDVCRHFFPTEFIKKYIDLLASYKMNVFHWHLSDDQGWRIEIKKYPELTRQGAWRKGSMIGAYSDHKFDTLTYGGFYSQDEIRDIVSYAANRHITIVPEIEMPGHAVAAISAYPFLSCKRQKIPVEKAWGVFDDVFCTRDSVFAFLQDVLDEVCELFPGNTIHIGGDECPKTRWKSCADCQKRMKDEKLKDEHELQSYFIRRIETFLNLKGRSIIGWDEILEGGLAPNAAVMSWRGVQGGIEAAHMKHKVVMSPGRPCYFDHYQTRDIGREPLAIGGFNPVDSVYAFEPVPTALNSEEQKYIAGAQANVWTEYILNGSQVEYMVLPRLCALSEVLWTPKEKKDFSLFLVKLQSQRKEWDRNNYNYAKHLFPR